MSLVRSGLSYNYEWYDFHNAIRPFDQVQHLLLESTQQ